MSEDKKSSYESIGYMGMPGERAGQSGREVPGQSAPAAERPEMRLEARQQTVAPAPAASVGRTVIMGPGSYVSPMASVQGDVQLGEQVFVAPGASIRGDTGARIYIGNQSNVQDGAVVHALPDRSVAVGGRPYAVYVGQRVSLAHQVLLHGPVAIGDDVFVGFRVMVVNSVIGKGCVIWHGAVISDVEIPDGRLVPAGAIIDTPERARALAVASTQLKEFAASVVRDNRRYAQEYSAQQR